jgi:hypothetical protein
MELISEAIKTATYDIGENKSATMNNSLNQSQIFLDEDDDAEADFQMSSPVVEEQKSTKSTDKTPVTADLDDDSDDLPF